MQLFLVPLPQAKPNRLRKDTWGHQMGALLAKMSQLTDARTTTCTPTIKDTRSCPEIPLQFLDGGLQSSLAPEREWTLSGSPQIIYTKTQTTNKLWWHRQKTCNLKLHFKNLQLSPALKGEWTQSGSIPAKEAAQMEWREFPACASWSDLLPGDTIMGRKLWTFLGSKQLCALGGQRLLGTVPKDPWSKTGSGSC